MSKQLGLIIGALIILAIIGGGAAYLLLGNSTQKQEGSPVTLEKSPEQSTAKGSIQSLIAGGKNVMCTVKYPEVEGAAQGTVYVSGKNMRGDFTTTVEGKAFDSHIISDGAFMYTWASSSPQGVKIKIDTTQAVVQATPGSQQVDINKELDLDCSSWSVDNSKLTPPSDVKFTEVSVPASQSPQQTQGTGDKSSFCNQLTDPQAKAVCLQQTGN